VQIVSVNENQVQERLPVIRVLLVGAFEERNRALELSAVAVCRTQVGEEVRVFRSLAAGLFVGLDRAVPVFGVV
jgi:hypothetical protein